MNEIIWTRTAKKQMAKLPLEIRVDIASAIKAMVDEWPASRNIKSLTNRDDYRLRVGRYRVLFIVLPDGEIRVFRINEVKKRDDRTY